jgi:hypothetical protein
VHLGEVDGSVWWTCSSAESVADVLTQRWLKEKKECRGYRSGIGGDAQEASSGVVRWLEQIMEE